MSNNSNYKTIDASNKNQFEISLATKLSSFFYATTELMMPSKFTIRKNSCMQKKMKIFLIFTVKITEAKKENIKNCLWHRVNFSQ